MLVAARAAAAARGAALSARMAASSATGARKLAWRRALAHGAAGPAADAARIAMEAARAAWAFGRAADWDGQAEGLSPWVAPAVEEGRFMARWRAATGGSAMAGSWRSRRLPERFQLELARRQAAARPRQVVPDGAVSDAPERLDLEAVRAALRLPKEEVRVLVLFAGAGGSSWGLSTCPGMRVTTAVELDEQAAHVYEMNQPDHPVLRLDLNDPAEAA